MADITLNSGITTLTAGNNYIVDSVVDYGGGSVTSNGGNSITIKKGGRLEDATITSSTAATEIFVETTALACTGVVFSGALWEQAGEINVKSTSLLQNYTLPVGFEVKTLCFASTGDLGGDSFSRIAFASFDHYTQFYPFDPVGSNPLWIHKKCEQYYAEALGIFSTAGGDTSKMAANVTAFKRHGGRSCAVIQFRSGVYYLQNVNGDDFVTNTGDPTGLNIVRIRGVNNNLTQGYNHTYICTNWGNFLYYVDRYSMDFQPSNLWIVTDVVDWYGTFAREHDRQGYAYTRFQEDEETVSTDMELHGKFENVLFWGFYGAVYSGQYATAVQMHNVKFFGNRYGFYAHMECNLSRFTYCQFHQNAFSFTGGGYQCTMDQIEYTPENWYRDAAAVADTEHYFYHSRGAMHTMTFNNMYSEGYLGDSAAKFVHYKVAHGATGIIFRNSALSATGVQLKIYKPAGYIYAAPIGWTNRMITYKENSHLPWIVSTDDPFPLFGISNDGKPFFISDGGSNHFLGLATGTYHNWKGTPNFVQDGVYRYRQLKPNITTDYVNYNGLNAAHVRGGATQNFSEYIYDAGQDGFMVRSNMRIKLLFELKGTAQFKRPFMVSIEKLKLVITPYFDGTNNVIDGSIQYEGLASEILNSGFDGFRILLASQNNATSDLQKLDAHINGQGGDGYPLVNLTSYRLVIEQYS